MELNLKRFKIVIAVFMVLCIVATVVVPSTSVTYGGGGDLKNYGFNYALITDLGEKELSNGRTAYTELFVPALIIEYVTLLLLFGGLTFIFAVRRRAT